MSKKTKTYNRRQADALSWRPVRAQTEKNKKDTMRDRNARGRTASYRQPTASLRRNK